MKGKESDVTGIDPATIDRFYTFDWVKGDDTTVPELGVDDAVITKSYADDNKVAVGGKLKVQSASGDERTVVVRGIYDPPEIDQMLGSVAITQQAFDETFPQPEEPVHVHRRRPAGRGVARRRPRTRSATPSSTRATRSRRTTRRASRAS